MKIQTENQQQPATGQAAGKQPVGKEDATSHPARPRKGAAPRQQDSVELSGALSAELTEREVEQQQRVADIKKRLAAGEYRVDSRAVAEKILSGRSKK